LRKRGRVTLIKSMLSNLLISSLVFVLVGVANWLEKLLRDFLWGGLDNEFKFHFVNRKKVCTPILVGGLGIKNLITLNRFY
jgi:hypothetical protein